MSMQTKADARPRVAAVIPCYSAARHIGEAIGSILSQTYEPIDVIVVNDGSTDDFDGAIAPFRDRITVIEQPNSGQAAARNRALAAAEASYVAFLDADDVERVAVLDDLAQLADLDREESLFDFRRDQAPFAGPARLSA